MIQTAHLSSFRSALLLGCALLVSLPLYHTVAAQSSGVDSPIPNRRIIDRDQGDVYRLPEIFPGIQNVPFPRIFAMGDAGVALQTPAAIRLNPAAMGQDQHVVASFNLGSKPWLAVGSPVVDGWITTASLSFQPDARWAVGGHFTRQSFGLIDIKNGAGVVVGREQKLQTKAGVSGAFHVTDNWSVGAGIAYIGESFGEAWGGSLALDLGVRGRLVDRRRTGVAGAGRRVVARERRLSLNPRT